LKGILQDDPYKPEEPMHPAMSLVSAIKRFIIYISFIKLNWNFNCRVSISISRIFSENEILVLIGGWPINTTCLEIGIN
jgi:hypothetical protein